MNPDTRACIAYVAGALISGKTTGDVYDCDRSRHISITGTVNRAIVDVHDRERGCYLTGAPTSLYDFGRGAHVALNISGNTFEGQDFGDGHHFNGKVNGNSVSVYDFGSSSHFDYNL